MADTLQALAFEEAKRAITQQQASLDSLRTRTAVLFSASAIALSVFGVAGDKEPWGVRLVSVALLVLIGVLAVSIAKPRDWTFANRVDQLLADAASEVPVSVAQGDWASHMQTHWDGNQSQLDELMGRYEFGCSVFLALITWSAAAAFLPLAFLVVVGLASFLGLTRVLKHTIGFRFLGRFSRWVPAIDHWKKEGIAQPQRR